MTFSAFFQASNVDFAEKGRYPSRLCFETGMNPLLSKLAFEIDILNVGVIHPSTLPFDRLITPSEIEGLRTGESPIKYGQFVNCPYKNRTQPEYEDLNSRA